ncbi:hypothetical protein BC833DRAFT_596846 [Globomyces pollinis-pini]|nr:hypothetical protein BC833DRAFT_596846 [Globomyces pollinis-pini]
MSYNRLIEEDESPEITSPDTIDLKPDTKIQVDIPPVLTKQSAEVQLRANKPGILSRMIPSASLLRSSSGTSTRVPLTRAFSMPWTAGGLPKDQLHAQLVNDIAGYLLSFGAPSYRVDARLKDIATMLDVPFTAFYLPTNFMLSLGDGSVKHPSRTTFHAVSPTWNMGKLLHLDKFARDIQKITSKKSQNAEIENQLLDLSNKLKVIVAEPSIYQNWQVILSCSVQAACLVMVIFNGDFADAAASFLLGGFACGINLFASKYASSLSTTIFVSFFVSLLATIVGNQIFWKWTGNQGICNETVIISSLVLYLPGTQFAVSLMEVGYDFAAAGAVRMFLAFVKSMQLGFGISAGSKTAIYLMDLAGLWDAEAHASVCEPARYKPWWIMLFYLPMTFATLINLKSVPIQWPTMAFVSTIAFFTLQICKMSFNVELSLIVTSFTLGVISNYIAKTRNEVALPSIMAGIMWIVPGGIGAQGAAAAFSDDGGSDFMVEVLRRSLSMVIGLYMANLTMSPLVSLLQTPTTDLDKDLDV